VSSLMSLYHSIEPNTFDHETEKFEKGAIPRVAGGVSDGSRIVKPSTCNVENLLEWIQHRYRDEKGVNVDCGWIWRSDSLL
jgi:hypothetical protein